MKFLSALVFFVSLVVISSIAPGCKSSSTEPVNPNFSLSDFPTTESGGDIRGTWKPNTPFLKHVIPGSAVVMNKNTGSGTIVFTGSSATQGTFTQNNFAVSYSGYAVRNTTRDTVQLKSTPEEEMPESINGTWKTNNGLLDLTVTDPDFGVITLSLPYAVTSRGLFYTVEFYDSNTGSVLGTVTQGFRK